MRFPSRRYPWIGGTIILGAVVILLFNIVGFGGWSPLDMFGFEMNVRSIVNPEDAKNAWTQERTRLLEEVAQLKGLADENTRLREALHFFSTNKYQYTIANTISRDPFSSSLVYLDVGSDDGVAVGQPVVIGTGTLIGKILKVSAKHATLELLTGDSARIAVKALDDTGTRGILRGSLGTGARLEYIRDVQGVPVGTILVTSGLEPLVPQGLLIGTIQKITETDAALFAYADVLPAADLSQLTIVSVLRGL